MTYKSWQEVPPIMAILPLKRRQLNLICVHIFHLQHGPFGFQHLECDVEYEIYFIIEDAKSV